MRPVYLVLTFVLALPATAQDLTPCQQCCAPGGDCSKAFKGGAGKCCGSLNGQSYCCPGAAGTPGAKCYNCGANYRCYMRSAGANICGTNPGHHRRSSGHPLQSPGRYEGGGGGAGGGQGMLLVAVGVAVVAAVLCCARGSHADRFDSFDAGKPPVAFGSAVPVPGCSAGGCAQPAYGAPMPAGGCYPSCGGYGGGYGYHAHEGYSGGAVAGSAAAGFVGGMLVNEALSHHGGHGGGSHEVHHYHHGGGHGDGGGYGGGDYGGFDDGDDGFDADS